MLPQKSPSPIYVIGHKNPDTDAICAAIGNAEFLRQEGEKGAIAARCGEIQSRTAWVLEKAGVEVPIYIPDVTPTAIDLCTKTMISVLPNATFWEAYQVMTAQSFNTLPVIDTQGKLHGILRHADLLPLLIPAEVRDETTNNISVRTVVASLANIKKTLMAQCLTDKTLSDEDSEISIVVGASSEPTILKRLTEYTRSGVISQMAWLCGDRPNVQRFAIDAGVKLLITTGGVLPVQELIDHANENGVTLMTTKLDTASAGMLIRCARRVAYALQENYSSFEPTATLGEIQTIVAKRRQDTYPILERNSKTVLGILTKTDLIDPRRKRVALVDHNEFSQAVTGIETADIVEVLDHHRLGAHVSSDNPIRFVNEPLGSTSTLVARRFYHRHMQPSPGVALCLCAGILSDTMNLKSPTSTETDEKMLNWLIKLTGLDKDEFCTAFFSEGSMLRSGESAISILNSDRKEFEELGSKFSLSQLEEVGLFGFEDLRSDLQQELEEMLKENSYKLAALLVTDVLTRDSYLLVVAAPELLDCIDCPRVDHNLFHAPGLVSRKKQLLPAISRALRRSLQIN